MPNREIQAAWHYHNGTKHPDGYLMDPWHGYDPMDNPLLFKIYRELEPIPLSFGPSNDPTPASTPDSLGSAMPALAAISASTELSSGVQVPDFQSLSKILQFSAGITKRIEYPWGEMAFRAAACTGALFHIELYLVCGDLPGLEAGVYHFDPIKPALDPLRKGDYRSVLVEASGNHPSLANAPAVICYTDVYWRNACKYQAREYRHAFWDCGTILANTLAVSSANGISSQVIMGYVDSAINGLLDLDTQREVSLALAPLGYAPDSVAGPAPKFEPLSLETVPISERETVFPTIGEMHQASSLEAEDEVVSWRDAAESRTNPEPTGRLVILDSYPEEELPRDPIDAVIKRRGSSRRFTRESISFRQLSAILQRSTQGIPADFLEPTDRSLNDLYLIVNSVDGLPSGAYVFHIYRQALELLEEGEGRNQAGYLGLQQALPADASVNIYLMADLGRVLANFGNRGYRAAQMEASILAGKIYLAAYAQRLGATGLTFFDDPVTQFFSPHAKDKSAMFLVAVGNRAKQ